VTSDREAPPQFPTVDYLRQVPREDRLADKVADLLTRAVLSGQLVPGDRLPPERVLGERLGVSRTVVREAIRSLAAKGLVEVRSGSGSVIARVGAASVTETVQLFIKGAAVDVDDIDEVREMLEVQVAGLAAERATDDDLRALRAALRGMATAVHDHREYAARYAEFHRCLAATTRNALYAVMLDSIGETTMTLRRGMLSLRGESRATLHSHERILECIVARDGEGARREMRLHLAELRRIWERALDASPAEALAADLDPRE
jgi:GntR family transcriptional repressor for pyruvate dehydrogenase complex